MKSILNSIKCCLNPKVMGGLGVVALAVVIFSPHSFARLLPVLFVLICPLSMGAMAFAMTRGGRNQPVQIDPSGNVNSDQTELAQLRSENERLRESQRASGTFPEAIVGTQQRP